MGQDGTEDHEELSELVRALVKLLEVRPFYQKGGQEIDKQAMASVHGLQIFVSCSRGCSTLFVIALPFFCRSDLQPKRHRHTV